MFLINIWDFEDFQKCQKMSKSQKNSKKISQLDYTQIVLIPTNKWSVDRPHTLSSLPIRPHPFDIGPNAHTGPAKWPCPGHQK